MSILDFTRVGSKFLFEGSGSRYGYLWVHFCISGTALPSFSFQRIDLGTMFYLGIIQKGCEGTWHGYYPKPLGISGAESLSVAGNIFLGQTEAPLY